MIEMYSVTDTNRFTYNNEAYRKGENSETDFSEIMSSGRPDDVNAVRTAEGFQAGEGEDLLPVSDMEMVSYTYSGRMSLFGTFTGRNINFEA